LVDYKVGEGKGKKRKEYQATMGLLNVLLLCRLRKKEKQRRKKKRQDGLTTAQTALLSTPVCFVPEFSLDERADDGENLQREKGGLRVPEWVDSCVILAGAPYVFPTMSQTHDKRKKKTKEE